MHSACQGVSVLIGVCMCGGDVVITGTSYVRLHIPGEQVSRVGLVPGAFHLSRRRGDARLMYQKGMKCWSVT